MSRLSRLIEAHPQLTEHYARVLLVKRAQSTMEKNGEDSVAALVNAFALAIEFTQTIAEKI